MVEHGARHLRHGRSRHCLVVSVAVTLHPHLCHLAEGEDVAPAAGATQHGTLGQAEQLGLLPGQDRVPAVVPGQTWICLKTQRARAREN